MAISFEGEFEVQLKKEDVYRFLASPERFAPLLPGFESMEVEDPKTCRVKLKVGVPQIPGTANVRLHLAEEKPPDRARYSGKGTLTGGSMNLTSGFDLVERDGKTAVQWRGEVLIAGRLQSLAGGLLKPLAKKSIQKLIDNLQAELSAQK